MRQARNGKVVRNVAGLTTLALAATAMAGCSSRSAEAFCDRLDEGERRMAATADEAMSQDNAGLGLAMALGNIGEFRQMVDELAKAAPDEIRADAERTRDVVDGMTDDLGDGSIGGAFSAAASALFDGLANRTAFENVDEFAQANCGTTVFAMGQLEPEPTPPPDTPAPETVDPPADVDDVETAAPDPCEQAPDPLDGNARADELVRALTWVEELDGSSAQDISDVIDAIEDLEPDPSSSYEALGRLRWDGEVTSAQLTSFEGDLRASCDADLFDHRYLDTFERLGPNRTGDRFTLGTYDPDCWSPQPVVVAQDRRVVGAMCSDAWHSLDLETGDVEALDHLPDEQWIELAAAGDDVFWVETDITEVSGLESSSTTVTVRRASTVPGEEDVDDVHVIEGDQTLQVDLEGVTSSRVVLSVSADEASEHDVDLLILDHDGEVVERIGVGWGSRGRAHVFGPVYWLESDEAIDVDSLQRHTVDGPISDDDVCGGVYVPGTVFEYDDDGQLQATAVPEPEGWLNNVDLVDGGLIERDGGALRKLEFNGEERWVIEAEVVHNWAVFDGQLYVENATGELIAVDTDDGTEAEFPDGYEPIIEALLWSSDEVTVDADVGEAYVWRSEDDTDLTVVPVASCR